MLELNRPIYFHDLETTGLSAQEDRIVQIGLIRMDTDGSTLEWKTLVNPGIPIPEAASAVHHITDELVANEKPFSHFAPALARRFTNVDFAGYNCKSFDLPFFSAEFKRAGVEVDLNQANVIDAYKLYLKVKPRNLANFVADMCGDDPEYQAMQGTEFHDALVDVRWTMKGLLSMLNKYPHLPRTAAELHAFSFPPDANAVTSDSRVVYINRIACINFGKHKGSPLGRVPRQYFQYCLDTFTDLPDDTRRVFSNAMGGLVPTP